MLFFLKFGEYQFLKFGTLSWNHLIAEPFGFSSWINNWCSLSRGFLKIDKKFNRSWPPFYLWNQIRRQMLVQLSTLPEEQSWWIHIFSSEIVWKWKLITVVSVQFIIGIYIFIRISFWVYELAKIFRISLSLDRFQLQTGLYLRKLQGR